MIILGIDPGYAIIGWGVIRYERGRFQPLDFGAILTAAGTPFPERLQQIYDQLKNILERHHPDTAAVEKLYFQNNKTTAIEVAEARGVILLALQQAGVPAHEYTPLQVKCAVTGYGQAQKPQVMEMTRRLLRLKEVPRPDDTADALAMAICHAQYGGSTVKSTLLNMGGTKK
jgi:crossover junction endodeoxyribonuclease RuvC